MFSKNSVAVVSVDLVIFFINTSILLLSFFKKHITQICLVLNKVQMFQGEIFFQIILRSEKLKVSILTSSQSLRFSFFVPFWSQLQFWLQLKASRSMYSPVGHSSHATPRTFLLLSHVQLKVLPLMIHSELELPVQ